MWTSIVCLQTVGLPYALPRSLLDCIKEPFVSRHLLVNAKKTNLLISNVVTLRAYAHAGMVARTGTKWYSALEQIVPLSCSHCAYDDVCSKGLRCVCMTQGCSCSDPHCIGNSLLQDVRRDVLRKGIFCLNLLFLEQKPLPSEAATPHSETLVL
jgi:hypothetical protein